MIGGSLPANEPKLAVLPINQSYYPLRFQEMSCRSARRRYFRGASKAENDDE